MAEIRFQSRIATPWEAKQVRLQCPNCSGQVFVTVEWNVTAEQRQRLISEAINLHRSDCSASPPSAEVVWAMEYPRV